MDLKFIIKFCSLGLVWLFFPFMKKHTKIPLFSSSRLRMTQMNSPTPRWFFPTVLLPCSKAPAPVTPVKSSVLYLKWEEALIPDVPNTTQLLCTRPLLYLSSDVDTAGEQEEVQLKRKPGFSCRIQREVPVLSLRTEPQMWTDVLWQQYVSG